MELAAGFLYHYPHRIDVSHRIYNILRGADRVEPDVDDREFGTLL